MIAIGDLAYDDDGRGVPAEPTSTYEYTPPEELLEAGRAIRERTDRAARLRAIQAERSRRQREIERAIEVARKAEGLR